MKIGYITSLSTAKVIYHGIHFHSSDAICEYQKYESISSLINGILRSEIDFGVIPANTFSDYMIETSRAGKPPNQLRTIARFLIKETFYENTADIKYRYTLYSLIG